MRSNLYGKIKERRGESLIGVNTQNAPYFSIVATQHKTKAGKTPIDKGKARINNL